MRAILIALLVPAVALAGGPRKKGKAAKKTDETEKADKANKPDKPDAATAPATTPPPAAATGTGSSTLSGSAQQAAGTTPTAGTAPGGTPQPQPQPQGQPQPSGAGSGADAPVDPGEAKGKGPDVDALRQEYLSLRDELFKSRARANAVASQLYSTRMTIKFAWGSARYYGVSKASIRLDGATVYEDATGSIATDDGVRFDGYVAPGRHIVTFHVEAIGKDDDSFTSATETQIVVKAVASKDLVVAAKGHDNGDIAYAWKRSEKGSYGLGIDVAVKSVPSGAAPRGKK